LPWSGRGSRGGTAPAAKGRGWRLLHSGSFAAKEEEEVERQERGGEPHLRSKKEIAILKA